MGTALRASALALVVAASATIAGADDGDKKNILFIAGNRSHGYGSHEHYAGSRLLATTLQEGVGEAVSVDVSRGWPSDADQLEWADTIVIYSDGGGGHLALRHLDELEALMDQGKGFVCLHYAVEVPKGEPGDRWLDWLGGYFETDWSVNPHWDAEFESLPDHAITRGVDPFEARDEWYFHMRFRPEMEGVTPILSAVPPASTMERPDGPHSGNPAVREAVAKGEPQHVAWAFERPEGGRSFGFTGGHFHWNWGHDDVRRLVANAILWTAGGEVPEGGVPLQPLGIEALEENQDEAPPENYDRERIREQFPVSITPGRMRESSDEAKMLYSSPVVNADTPGHRVDIELDVTGVRRLYLAVADAGDGFSCDWADWLQPTVTTESGEQSLVDQPFLVSRTGWGAVHRNKNAEGGPLIVGDEAVGPGIGVHAPSVLGFELPEDAKTFRATAALDAGGTRQNDGQSTSVRFLVTAGAPPRHLASADRAAASEGRRPENALAGLKVADGLDATLVASEPELLSLTNLDIDHRGRIWVCEVVNYRGHNGKREEGDRILILEDTDGDGRADEVKTYYQGRDIDSAMGICVLGNEVIVSASPHIWRFTDEDGDDRPDRKELLFTDTGQPQHDHSAHSFLFGPDGKLYWNFGNTGRAVHDARGEPVVDIHGRTVVDNGKPFFGGMPFRCDLDGSNFEVLAHNFRNNYEIAVDSFGRLWQSDNDDDGNRGTRINFVIEQGNYGYRDEMTGDMWRSERIGMHEEIPLRHWHLNDPGVIPNTLQTGAGSPSGITVYEGNLLPDRFQDEVLHCDPGPNVVRAYPAERDGAGFSAEMENVLHGEGDQWFRPVDVCTAPDGSVFVTDWYDPGVGGHRMGDLDRGRLFRLAPPGARYEIPEYDYATADGAAEALRNPAASVRYLAWQALHAMGRRAEPALVRLWQDENPRLRARALWLLGKIEGRGRHWVDEALADRDVDIRATGVRLARQLNLPPVEIAREVARDEAAAVRREALVSLRFDRSQEMPAAWAALAARYDGEDRWYLEAAGLASDLRPEECFAAWLEEIDGRWDTPAGRDIVWRVRAARAAEYAARIITDASLDLAETDRYFRSLEFHAPEARRPALLTLLEQEPGAKNDAVIVRALERLDDFDWRAAPRVREALASHLDRRRERADGAGEFLRLVERFEVRDREAEVLEIVVQGGDTSEGVRAAELLLRTGGRDALRETLLAAEPADPAVAVATALGLSGKPGAVRLLVEAVRQEELPYEIRAAATRGLARDKPGQTELLELADADRLPGDVSLLAGGLLSRADDEAVRERAAAVLPLPTMKDAAPLPPVDQLASREGDVARGEVLFRQKATCANCHIVNGFGKSVGPDLSEIGNKLSREAMYISILDPSAGISHNYENWVALLDTGQVISGLKVAETEDTVTIRSAEAIDRQLNRDDLEALRPSEKSIMPEDLHHMVDEQGLVDIVEYLMSLKGRSSP